MASFTANNEPMDGSGTTTVLSSVEISEHMLEAADALVAVIQEETQWEAATNPFYLKSKEVFEGLTERQREDMEEDFDVPMTSTYEECLEKHALTMEHLRLMETGVFMSEEKWGQLSDSLKLEYVGEQGMLACHRDKSRNGVVVEKLAGVGVPSYVQVKAAVDEEKGTMGYGGDDGPPSIAARKLELKAAIADHLRALQANFDVRMATLQKDTQGEDVDLKAQASIAEVLNISSMWEQMMNQYKRKIEQSREGLARGDCPPMPPGTALPSVLYADFIETGEAVCSMCSAVTALVDTLMPSTYEEITTTLLEATHELVGIVVEEAMAQTSPPPFHSKEEFAGLSDGERADGCEELGLPPTATYDECVAQFTLVTSAQCFMQTGQLISEEKWGLLTDATKLQFVGNEGPFSDSDGYTTVVEKLAGVVGVPSYVQLKAAFDEAASAAADDPDAPPPPAARAAELHGTVARALRALQAQLDADLAMLEQTQDGDRIFTTITEVGQVRLMWQAQVTQYTQLGQQYANAVQGGMPRDVDMPPLDPMVTYGAVIETGKAVCTQCDVFLDKVGKMSSSSSTS